MALVPCHSKVSPLTPTLFELKTNITRLQNNLLFWIEAPSLKRSEAETLLFGQGLVRH